MKKLLVTGCLVLAGSGSALGFDWTPVEAPGGLTPQEQKSFELGVVSSSALLCNYYDLYGQLNSLATDVIMFEKGKATLVRETKKINPEQCKSVLAEISGILTR